MTHSWLNSAPVPARGVRLAGRSLQLLGLLAVPIALGLSWLASTDGKDGMPVRPEMVVLPPGSFVMNNQGGYLGAAEGYVGAAERSWAAAELYREAAETAAERRERLEREVSSRGLLALLGTTGEASSHQHVADLLIDHEAQFRPGSEPIVREIAQAFAMSRTEVTQGMYERVMGRNPSARRDRGVRLTDETFPVQRVDWLEAVEFCNRLSLLEGLEPAYRKEGDQIVWEGNASGYRLPTSTEWEYAALSGTYGIYSGTSERDELCLFGNVADSSATRRFGTRPEPSFECDDGIAGLAPAGSFRPNRWGLYDMTGNVAEWVWDWWASAPEMVEDLAGPRDGIYRVVRGGSWYGHPDSARVIARVALVPGSGDVNVGFRLARTLTPTPD